MDFGADAPNKLRGYLEVQLVVLYEQHASLNMRLGWLAGVLGRVVRVGEMLQNAM